MTPSTQCSLRSPAASAVGKWRAVAALGALLAAVAAPASSREIAPYAARAGLEDARLGASAWAPDAFLVYVENDEALDPSGAADRWGYLFYSPRLDRARAYSICEGRIVVAENLDIKLEPPPLAAEWIDSGAALAAAEDGGARAFCEKEGGRLSTMLLMRGAFDDKQPDETTWMLVYTAPNGPSLYVVVDAVGGKVRRTWRG
jgi:hypothetical protein